MPNITWDFTFFLSDPWKICKYIHFNTLIKVLYALRKYKSYKLLKVAKTFKINPESYKNLFYKESLISSHDPQINGGTREGWIYNKYLWKNIYENIQMYSYLTRDKKGWTQRVGLANVSPKGLYHVMRGWIKLDSGR